MKNLFLTAASFLIGLTSYCQDIIVTVMDVDSMGCQKTMAFEIVNVSATADAGMLTFDWGDGSSLVQYPYSVGAQGASNSSDYFFLTHSYALGGNYTVDAQAVSNFPNVNISMLQGNQLIAAFGANNCGYAYLALTMNFGACYPSSLNNAQLDFTDNLNNTSTVSGLNNTYNGLNPSNAPYTVSVNDAWLIAHNLTQVSADIVISGFNPDGSAIGGYQSFIVNWNSANATADPSFNYGSAWNFVAPLQTGNLRINLDNLTCGAMTSNLSVSVTMPSLYIPNTASLINANVTGNVLSFEVAPFVGAMWVNIPFTFPGTTPAGTAFCFDVAMTYSGDANVNNNTGQICGVVLNSYDPNDKQVNLGERLDPDTKEKLVYKIQFQNDGNFNAVNVKVTDVIDANLDLSTFRVLRSSHPLASSINSTTRQVEFMFHNIMLDASSDNLPGSQGFVEYQIDENANLALGSEIENTANIYFDFNAPIVTNTTYNINQYPLGVNELNKISIQMYPNPVKENVTFKGGIVDEVKVFDLSGKLILSSDKIIDNTVSVAHLSNGFYTVHVKTSTGSSTIKMSVQH